MAGLVRGTTYPLRGLGFLYRNRSLWKYAAIPLLINLAVVAVLAVVVWFQFDAAFAWATGFLHLTRPEHWYGWPLFALEWLLKYGIGGVLLVVSAIALYVAFLILAGIIASPFNDALSERVEMIVAGRTPPDSPLEIRTMIREGGTAILEEVRKAAFFVGFSILFLGLHLLPGLGSLVYPVVTGAFTMFFLSLEFVDFAMSRRKLRFAAKRDVLWRHKRASFGFGAVMFGAMTIPGANLLVLPIGAVAGTLLYLDLEGPGESAATDDRAVNPAHS